MGCERGKVSASRASHQEPTFLIVHVTAAVPGGSIRETGGTADDQGFHLRRTISYVRVVVVGQGK